MVTHHRGTFHDMPASDYTEHVNCLIEFNSFILYSIGVKPMDLFCLTGAEIPFQR